MGNNYSEILAFKIIENIRSQLEEIDGLTSVNEIKEKVHRLIEIIDDETLNNKAVFMEKVYCKIKETNSNNEQLNACMYLLYRNLGEGKISLKEAEKLYKMYLAEYT